jgi:hypothetical protein
VPVVTKLFADDTPIPVLDPGRGRTKTGRLWVYARDEATPNSSPAFARHCQCLCEGTGPLRTAFFSDL